MSKILIRETLEWSGTGSLAVGREAEGMEFFEPGKETALGPPYCSQSITTRKCNKKEN